jgi:hypothetical protein
MALAAVLWHGEEYWRPAHAKGVAAAFGGIFIGRLLITQDHISKTRN